MNDIQGESYLVRLEQSHNTVVFKGALRLSGMEDYAPILNLLKSTLENTLAPVVLDLRELDFLNSSGITMLSRFIIEARNKIGVNVYCFASEAIAWHARSLKKPAKIDARFDDTPDLTQFLVIGRAGAIISAGRKKTRTRRVSGVAACTNRLLLMRSAHPHPIVSAI